MFRLWTHANDATLASLCRGVLYRQLYKTIDLSHLADAAEFEAKRLAAVQAVTAAGGDGAYDLFADEPSDTAYADDETEGRSMGHGILVQDAMGKVVELSDLSPIPAALRRKLMFRRLHVAASWKEVVQEAVG